MFRKLSFLFLICISNRYLIFRNQTTFAAIENTTPARETRSSSVSQPIPVPTQVENYEKMQESRDRAKTFGGAYTGSPNGSPSDGKRI